MTQDRPKLYQRIATDIAALIENGTYPGGTRLPGERDLAETFQVSRPTIREAIIALELRGLVAARHGSGIYILDPATAPTGQATRELDAGAFELIEARELFEGEAAALAAKVIGDADLAKLRALVARMASVPPESDAAFQADRDFHLGIADATGNSVVRTVVELLWDIRHRSPMCAHMFGKAWKSGYTTRVDEHQRIVDALESRDPEAARIEMTSHLRRVTADLLDATEMEMVEDARTAARAQRDLVDRRGVR